MLTLEAEQHGILCPDHLWRLAFGLKSQSVSASTKKCYDAMWSKWLVFCCEVGSDGLHRDLLPLLLFLLVIPYQGVFWGPVSQGRLKGCHSSLSCWGLQMSLRNF